VLGLQAVEPFHLPRADQLRLGALGERQEPVAMALPRARGFPGFDQALDRVLAQRLQQPVALLPVARLDLHERLVDELRQQVEDRGSALPVRAYRLGGFE
jgi:hypothetical protein